jgi:sec-independent protein translocase protein TatA
MPIRLGPPELIIILVILLLLFGASRLPEIGASLGKGIREFRKTITGADEETPPAQTGVTQPKESEKRGS